MIDQPAFPYRICYIEDSPFTSRPVKLGLEHLLGAEVDLFTTTTAAQNRMHKAGYDQWQVFVIDNRTGFEDIRGIDLAREIRKNFPEGIVVSLCSSDYKEMADFGIEKLRGMGIEFWYKDSEAFLMIPWLADCAKEKRMIPRTEWLTKVGEPTEYLGANEPSRLIEKALVGLVMGWVMRGSLTEDTKGVLMRMDTVAFLRDLVSPEGDKKGKER